MRLGQIVVATAIALLVSGDNFVDATCETKNDVPTTTGPTKSFSHYKVDESVASRGGDSAVIGIGSGSSGSSGLGTVNNYVDYPSPESTGSSGSAYDENTGVWERVKAWWERVFGDDDETEETATLRLRLANRE